MCVCVLHHGVHHLQSRCWLCCGVRCLQCCQVYVVVGPVLWHCVGAGGSDQDDTHKYSWPRRNLNRGTLLESARPSYVAFRRTMLASVICVECSWTDHVRNEAVLLRVNEQWNTLHERSKRKANCIGHILRRNCLLKQVIEGKIKGEMEVARRRGRRRKKLLADIKERRGYSHLKEEALNRTMWRAGFGRGFRPLVRQTARWTKPVVHVFRRSYCHAGDCFNSGEVLVLLISEFFGSRLLLKNSNTEIHWTVVTAVVLYERVWVQNLVSPARRGWLRTECRGEYLDLRGGK